jgi:two-component system chemotaxis response regulator CheB
MEEVVVANDASSSRLVVIAASAGGLQAIIDVLAPLRSDFPAAIAIVQHRGPMEPERLVAILAAKTRLRVRHAEDGAPFQPGTVYVCPPGVHMTAEHCVRLIAGPKLRFVQPNADLMFESVGRTYGERAVGIVLSGAGSDAALGSVAIANAGGTVLAQQKNTCAFTSMPQTALSTGAVDKSLAPAEIAQMLNRWGADGNSAVQAAWQAGATDVTKIRVLLVDDHRIVLDGLGVLLDGEPDMSVVAKVEDGARAIDAAAELTPDVVVMDIRMPGVDGVEATRRILAGSPTTRVLALSSDSHTRCVDEILRAGAMGYLTKHRAFGELVQAIRKVIQGKIYLSREIAQLVTAGLVAPPAALRSARPEVW